jgi:O-antigen ligase
MLGLENALAHPANAVAWHEMGRLATIFVPLLFWASPPLLARLAAAPFWRFWPLLLAAGLLSVAGGMAYDRWIGADYALAKLNRGVSYGLLFAWPAAWLIGRRWGARGVILFVAAMLPALLLTHSRAAQLGFVLGGGAAALGVLWPRFVGGALAVGCALATFWPWAVQRLFLLYPAWIARLPESWTARVEIWDYFSYRALERPWFGHGVGTSFTLPYLEPHGALYTLTHGPAAHPHNVFMQLWVELGGVGVVIGLALLVTALGAVGRLAPSLRACALGAWTTFFVIALYAYDIWTDSFLACAVLLLVVFRVLGIKEALSPLGDDEREKCMAKSRPQRYNKSAWDGPELDFAGEGRANKASKTTGVKNRGDS